MSRDVLVFRVDTNKSIGYGHFIRSLALAEAFKLRGGKAVFVTSERSEFLKETLEKKHFEFFRIEPCGGTLQDATDTAQVMRKLGAQWAVIDGYQFDEEYQQFFKQQLYKTLFIDDTAHSKLYHSNFILNQNPYAHEGLYDGLVSDKTKLLLGSSYTLLRSEFLSQKREERKISERIKKVLVTFGGGESFSPMSKTIEALMKLGDPQLEVKCIFQGSPSCLANITERIKKIPMKIDLIESSQNMPELMMWADLAISGAGSICWEMSYLGLPAIIMPLAENQSFVANSLEPKNVVINMGWHSDVEADDLVEAIKKLDKDSGMRETMLRNGQNLIDGEGANRILDAINIS